MAEDEVKEEKEEKFTIELMREYAGSMFGLAPNTFEAVCIEHSLQDTKSMTKKRFLNYYEKYRTRPITNQEDLNYGGNVDPCTSQ